MRVLQFPPPPTKPLLEAIDAAQTLGDIRAILAELVRRTERPCERAQAQSGAYSLPALSVRR